ncbi:hypothetical protein PMAYCL1PPCAC_07859 [Pristionchus mayeri]|uniref:Uncharacterized protein n=1 Tax=Pristionchus mayeri TaxID=1317129 RepID=A0AAN4ZDR6_9BILA|nr:hypothetical protein PMAYCL1PPCAC_07859 [Pristionchus mayeri]
MEVSHIWEYYSSTVPSIESTWDEVVHPIMMLLSGLRISGCAILTGRCNTTYQWFAPLFSAEAVCHSLFFIYEFLLNYYEDLLTEIASIWDASVKKDSVCEKKEFTGFAFAYMVLAVIAVFLTLLTLVGWCACSLYTSNLDKRIYFIILFTAVAVRVPGLDVLTHHILVNPPAPVLIVLREIPLIYPLVFLVVTRGRLYTSFREFPTSETD